MEECRNAFHSLFGGWGYTPFLPSGMQLMESAWERLPSPFRRRLVALSSPFGEPCCLRGDITLAAVSHLASHHSPGDRPLRICYSERVYVQAEQSGGSIESFQIGGELVGGEWPGADAEVLFLLMRFLEEIGLGRSVLVLGDASFLAGATRGLDDDTSRHLVEALGRRSLVEYRRVVGNSGLSNSRRAVLERIPDLQGDEGALDEASRLLGNDEPLLPLRSILSTLKSLGYGERITIDLSLVRELGYYSGPLFEVYSESSGRPIGGGGRYDRLLSLCGIDGQATGFGLDLQRMAELSCFKSQAPAAMAWFAGLRPGEALERAERLAMAGGRIEMNWSEDRSSSIEQARAKKCSYWIDLSSGSKIELDKNRTKPCKFWKGELK